MTLKDFCESFQTQLVIRRRNDPLQIGGHSMERWYADVEHFEILKGSFLTSTFGDGRDPNSAVTNLCKNLTGKRLVKRAYQDSRMEIGPITVEPGDWES